MNSRTTTLTPDLGAQLTQLGLKRTAQGLEDLLARATTGVGPHANCWRNWSAPKWPTKPAAAWNADFNKPV
jgi:hypothetical protein